MMVLIPPEQRIPYCTYTTWADRSMYRSLSLVAVDIHLHEWAVIRPPYFYEIGAATGRRYSAFQPVFTRYKLL